MKLPESSPKVSVIPPPLNHNNKRCLDAICDTKTKRRKGDDETPVRDRISSLPDVLLHIILSSLSTKDAVATSVLSKRWRQAFTWVTRLHFDTSPISHCHTCRHMTSSFPRFKVFVDNVLQACQSQQTTSFTLHITNFKADPDNICSCIDNQDCLPEMEPDRLNAWMCFPLTRGVTLLDICAYVKYPGELPSALYTCRTLEILKLFGTFDLRAPSSICLPNLKELHLTHIKLPDDDSLTRLVSRCPSLEHLYLESGFLLPTPFSISSPSLRRLTISITHGSFSSRSKLTLDVPSVEYLVYHDVCAREYSIGNLNSLVEAEVNTLIDGDESHIDNIISVISPLSNAQRLSLMDGSVELLDYCCLNHKLPVFRNLNHLELGCFGYYHWHKVLMDLLINTPVLKTLVFPEGIMHFTDEELYMEVSKTELQSWSTSQTIPSCVGFHLEKILIKMYKLTEWELSMVKYFLKNTLVLEELTVVCNTSVLLVDRISHDTTLQKLPRGSMTCSIKVQ